MFTLWEKSWKEELLDRLTDSNDTAMSIWVKWVWKRDWVNWHFHLCSKLEFCLWQRLQFVIFARLHTHTRRTSRLSLRRRTRSDSQNVERRTQLKIDTHTCTRAADTFQSRALSISISICGRLSNQPLIANMYATQSNHRPSQSSRSPGSSQLATHSSRNSRAARNSRHSRVSTSPF